MKAIVAKRHGSPEVLQLQEIKKPVPADNELLIKVYASTVTRGDVILRKMSPLLLLPMRLFGIKRKTIPGHEFAGKIETVGKKVTRFKVGDRVFGTTTGLSVGGNAEYICIPSTWKTGVLTKMAPAMPYTDAAAVPVGGMTALEILTRANIRPDEKVLVYGASGSVGTFAVQIAGNFFGAGVTGVCSTKNVALVKSLGAEKVIDYTQEDVTTGEQKYDVIFDAVGKLSAADVKNILTNNGRFLSVKTTTQEKVEYLQVLKNMYAEKKLSVVIDRQYSLAQVPEAHTYVETGHKAGNVVILVQE